MKLIELTEQSGQKVTVNPAFIVMLAADDTMTVVTLSEAGTIRVRQSVAEIRALIG
jgi:hypothetical protein